MITNFQTGRTEGCHDPPQHKRFGFHESGSTGRSPSALPGQGRQPQRNKFNLQRNKPWLSNLTS
jgi:hypothetical protein